MTGWVIPEFAWDPSGRRLLWTQNKFPDGRRVDQACVMREIRERFVRQLQGVDTVAQIPFTLGRDIRDEAAKLLRPPASYVYQGACGGAVTGPAAGFEQQTWIGHYE